VSARPAFLGLGLLASVLAAALSLELDIGEPPEDVTGIVPIRHVPKAQPRVASEDPEDHTDAWVATSLARPLFSRDRKPTPVAAKAGGPALTSLPRLTGVVVGPFGRLAIFAGSGDKEKPIAVSEGKTLGPYTVQAIQPGRVTVNGPDGERVVSLSADAATRQALAAEIPQPQQVQPGQQQGLPPGTLPGVPGVPNPLAQRPNLLNLRPGMQFQRGIARGEQPPRPNQEGSE
jgi:hypothetical protein